MHDGGVPRISAFYGIVIEMYFGDHPPPHFHALYAGEEALIVIETGEVMPGRFRLVRSCSCENGLSCTEPKCRPTGNSPHSFTRQLLSSL